MPFPFTRKSSSTSQRSSSVNASTSDLSKSTSSSVPPASREPRMNRSQSVLSFKSQSGGTPSTSSGSVKPAALLASFPSTRPTPASRRLSSFGNRSTTSVNLSNLRTPAASRTPSIRSAAILPAPLTLSSEGSQAHTNDIDNGEAARTAVRTASPDEEGDEAAYDSPDEFYDAEDVQDGPKSGGRQIQSPIAEAVPLPPKLEQYRRPDPRDTPLQADIRQIWVAVSLFLNSRMLDAEEILATHQKDRLYYSLGHSLITSMKALMTFEPHDLGTAIDLCKGTLELATKEKSRPVLGQRAQSWSERISGGIGGFTRGTALSLESAQRMTIEQRHAELAYAECLLLKALVGLIYAGDVLAFVREAFNMRTSYAIYRILARYIAEADSRQKDGYDSSIDLDFRSGVNFGNGNISLVLSLLPSSAIKVMEVFGFSGNRQDALHLLMSTGGWTSDSQEPSVKEGPGNEGLRRCVCDLTLLMYHLIIASVIPVPDVDVDLADKILHYNLQRYPQGVFFLYFSGRLYATQTRCSKAVEQYHKAIQSQKEYIQIHHICHWDLALAHLALADYPSAYNSLSVLAKDSNWSKAAYNYGKAITLYESLAEPAYVKGLSTEEVAVQRKTVEHTMVNVPKQTQKIAGKSLPFEKYAVRKSKKFLADGNYLALAGLELSYMLNALNLAPRSALYDKHLQQVDETIASLQLKQDHNVNVATGWWDDFCLAHFLKAVLLHLIVSPERHVLLDPPESPISPDEGMRTAKASLELVLENAMRIELDHHIAWFAHYEYGRLLMKMGDAYYPKAKEHFSLVLEGKVPLGPTKGKGRVSMQNVVVLRTNAAMDQLKELMKS